MEMDIISKIEGEQFLATDKDIETMAHQRQRALQSDARITGTYLKVLVALVAHGIGADTTNLSRRAKRAKQLPPAERKDHLAVFQTVADRCYAAVVRAVVT